MTRVCVGAPVRERAWILPTWLAALDAQRSHDLEVDVCCFLSPSADDTEGILMEAGATLLTDPSIESPRSPSDIVEHRWGSMDAYRFMAAARNCIVEEVEAGGYDYLFMLDTDIILHPDPLIAEVRPEQVQVPDIPRLLTGLGPNDVIGPLVNMDKRNMHLAWNYMEWVPDGPCDDDGQPNWARRPTDDLCMASGRHEVDVLLGALLIPVRDGLPRWQASAQGEDVGWPMNARRAGLHLFADTDIVCRHAMNVERGDRGSSLTDGSIAR